MYVVGLKDCQFRGGKMLQTDLKQSVKKNITI